MEYKSQEIDFPAELIPFGYSYRIDVAVFSNTISFERDEDHKFRARISYDELDSADKVDKDLLKEIANQLTIMFDD